MNRLLLATRNAHKKRELSQLLAAWPIRIVDLSDFPRIPEVDEDQPTLEGNAAKKAKVCASGSGLWSLADDTGLEVAALGGAPGVLTARYAGIGCTYQENNAKLLQALKGLVRHAVFRTVMALSSPDETISLAQGVLAGEIADAAKGDNGFGYDPVFYIPQRQKTLAELAAEEKNSLSHRALALAAILPHVKKAFGLSVMVLLAFAAAAPAKAGRTEPGQVTIWDEIMASQANRGLRLGARYLDAKQYEMALRELQRAVAANPKDPNAQMMLGAAYYWNGMIEESLECYRRSLELEPANAQSYMLIGISLAYKGEVPQAREAFKKAAEIDPSRPDVQMNLGSIEESMGATLDALDHFRRAVLLAPREPLYHFQLGMMYRKLGRDDDAAASLAEALKLFPQFEDALLELGAIDERRGEEKAAVRGFRKAVELKARDSVARFRLSRLYLKTGDARRARAAMIEAFHLTPEEGGAGLQLSVSYAGGKKHIPADGKPGQAAPPQPQADPNDPLSVFQRNLERIPLDQSALMQVDILFVPKPRLVRAAPEGSSLAKAFKRELDPRPAVKASRREFHIDASGGPQREAQIARVLENLRAVMKEAPAEADVRLGMNLNFTRPTSTPAGRADSAAAPKVSYQPRQVGNDLGLWIIGTGWMSLVEEVLPEPGEKPSHPDDSDWWVSTGLGFAALGDGQRALGAFERASQLDPRSEAAWLGRGVACVMTGNEKAAEASLQEALKINPKNRAAGEGLKWLQRPAASKQAGKGDKK